MPPRTCSCCRNPAALPKEPAGALSLWRNSASTLSDQKWLSPKKKKKKGFCEQMLMKVNACSRRLELISPSTQSKPALGLSSSLCLTASALLCPVGWKPTSWGRYTPHGIAASQPAMHTSPRAAGPLRETSPPAVSTFQRLHPSRGEHLTWLTPGGREDDAPGLILSSQHHSPARSLAGGGCREAWSPRAPAPALASAARTGRVAPPPAPGGG